MHYPSLVTEDFLYLRILTIISLRIISAELGLIWAKDYVARRKKYDNFKQIASYRIRHIAFTKLAVKRTGIFSSIGDKTKGCSNQ